MELEGFVDFTPLLHCAVYALVRKGEVVYVGKSRALGERLRTHWRKRKGSVRKSGLYSHTVTVGIPFDQVWVRACMLGELDRLEIEMIKKYQPRYNTRHKDVPRMKPDIPLEVLLQDIPALPYPMLPPAPEPRGSCRRRW